MSAVIRAVIGIVGVILCAALWRRYAGTGCLPLAIPMAAILMLTVSLREGALWRRRCLSAGAFRDGTALRRFTSAATLPTLGAVGVAVLLGTAAAVEVLRRPPEFLLLLAGGGVVAAVSAAALTRVLRPGLNAGARAVVVKAWAARFTALVLFTAMTAWTLSSPAPRWLRPDFFETLAGAAATAGSACPLTDTVLHLAILQESAAWWAMVQGDATVGPALSPGLHIAAWAGFLVADGIGALGFGRLLTDMVYGYARRNEDGDP